MTFRPVHVTGTDRPGPWLVTCDHARSDLPPELADLGLPASEMQRHIAYDIGALGVAEALGEALGAPVISAGFSRLLIDPNRGVDDPTLLMKLYDGTIVPGNRQAGAAEKARRIAAYWRPYHAAYSGLAARPGTLVCAVHSFTPQLRGRPPRPWELGRSEERREGKSV